MRSRPKARSLIPVGFAAFIAAGTILNLSSGAALLTFLPYSIMGSILIVRRPRHLMGWLLVLLSVTFSLVGRAQELAAFLDETPRPGWVVPVVWLSAMAAFGFLAGLAVLTATFPTGRLPAGRVGRVTRIALVFVAAVGVLQAVDPVFAVYFGDGTRLEVRNPVGIGPDWVDALLGGPAYMVVVGALLVCSVGLLLRFRRAGTVEREQDKWFFGSLVAVIVAIAFGFVATSTVDPLGTWGWIPAAFAFVLPPIAIGIAVTRYRLYDIDRIISRTIAYAAVSAILGLMFAAVVVALSTAFAAFQRGPTIAVAGSTLVTYAALQPVLKLVRRAVDRRFDRARYDADHTVARFSERLRYQTDLEAVIGDFGTTARSAVSPASMSLWVRDRGTRG